MFDITMKKLLLLVLLLSTLLLNYLLINGNDEIIKNQEKVFVTKIIDGDTIVADGEHVRLLGIDADERGYNCYNNAKKRLEELILNKEVVLEKDISDKDQYGRLLRYIIFNEENINLKLVKEGLVVARFYNDRKYYEEILNAEIESRNNKIGCKWNNLN